tara:strand:- start:454 stop:693 length:240 start_codon:yes stop_codon:yes gene_type:complete
MDKKLYGEIKVMKKSKRGRPPKKVKKWNPMYTKIMVRKILQEKLRENDHDIAELVDIRSKFIDSVLEELDKTVKGENEQ